MKKNELIEGEIYYISNNGFSQYLYRYKKTYSSAIDSNDFFIDLNVGKIGVNNTGLLNNFDNIAHRVATNCEKQYLLGCFVQNKFISEKEIKTNEYCEIYY